MIASAPRLWRAAVIGGVLVVTARIDRFAQAAPGRQDGCSRTVVSQVPSPDRARSATIVESVCGAGQYAQDVTADVELGGTTILGVDTGGHAEDRPRVTWSGRAVLDVTVPNHAFLRVLRLRVGDVDVRLHFDPNDPAGRAAWLHANGLPADNLPASAAP